MRGILAISSWDACRTIDYSGKEINDRDYSSSLFSKTSTLFLYNKNLMKDRRFASAESDSLEADTTGITDLKFNNSFSNQEYVINEQRYYGKFNISINPKSYSYEQYNYNGKFNITTNPSIVVIEPIDNAPYYDQGWLDDFCKGCWPGLVAEDN